MPSPQTCMFARRPPPASSSFALPPQTAFRSIACSPRKAASPPPRRSGKKSWLPRSPIPPFEATCHAPQQHPGVRLLLCRRCHRRLITSRTKNSQLYAPPWRHSRVAEVGLAETCTHPSPPLPAQPTFEPFSLSSCEHWEDGRGSISGGGGGCTR